MNVVKAWNGDIRVRGRVDWPQARRAAMDAANGNVHVHLVTFETETVVGVGLDGSLVEREVRTGGRVFTFRTYLR